MFNYSSDFYNNGKPGGLLDWNDRSSSVPNTNYSKHLFTDSKISFRVQNNPGGIFFSWW